MLSVEVVNDKLDMTNDIPYTGIEKWHNYMENISTGETWKSSVTSI